MQDIPTKSTGDSLTATEWNQVPDELENSITDTGQTLSGADLFQVSKAMSIYTAGGDFYTDSGSANAHVLTAVGTKKAPIAYFDGMRIRYLPGTVNTGATTVNAATIGVKSITDESGNALTGGELPAGVEAILTFDNSNDRFEIVRSGLTGTVKLTVFTSSGTHTPSPGVKSIKFTATGGGPGGGAADGQGAATATDATSGSAAATAILTTSVIDASYAIVIGALGAGGTAGGDGANGGATTVISAGVNISAGGGLGGIGSTGTSGNSRLAGLAGGTATGGDINLGGEASTPASANIGENAGYSKPGSSIWGGAGLAAVSAEAGGDATAPGSAGAAASSINVTTNFDGGDGVDGIVVVEEHF